MSKHPKLDGEVKILDSYCNYADRNWNASLGYGHDKEVLKQAMESEYWLFEALDMSFEEFYEYFENWRLDQFNQSIKEED